MEEMLIIAGFGGQGVQLIGKMLVEAGMEEGKEVSFLPSYGAEMRGGTSNCNVIISDEPVGSPIVNEATCVMALNRPSMDKFEGSVIPGKTLLINSSLVDRKAERTDIEAIYVPANDIANELGNTKVANMVMLGAYIAATGALQVQTLQEMLRHMFSGKKEALIPLNMEALTRGAHCVTV